MGHTTAQGLRRNFNEALKELNNNKLIHIGMDGPPVNWSLFRMIMQDRAEMSMPELINIGSCALHTIHRAFQCGIESTGWGLSDLLEN